MTIKGGVGTDIPQHLEVQNVSFILWVILCTLGVMINVSLLNAASRGPDKWPI